MEEQKVKNTLCYLGNKELNIKKNKILSVILAGGLSKRFGGDTKTLAKINGTTIFQKIIDFLNKQNTEIIINTNYDEKIFLDSNLPLVRDKNANFQGPLAGIFAAMEWIKEKKVNIEWILTVPSDTPFLPKNLLDVFISKINNNKKIYIARSNGKIHPVVGFWNISLIGNLEKNLNQIIGKLCIGYIKMNSKLLTSLLKDMILFLI